MNASLESDHARASEEGEATGESSLLTDDKSLTFRKRRLSLTNLRHLADQNGKEINDAKGANDGDDEDDDDDPFDFQCPGDQSTPPDMPNTEEEPHGDENGDGKAVSFRKRRLSLTQNRGETENSSHEEGAEPPNQRRRRASDASQSSMDSGQFRLKSRTVHAAELLAQPPPSPSVHQLYQQKTAPPQRKSIELGSSTEQQPKWKKRHTRHLHEDEKTLPFPRDVVGTFSCHGVEPIYEEDYLLEEDDDGEWVPHPAIHDMDKPTTAAKINQDRGGVAFPYGNCSRTALFAVYDGHGQGGELVAQFALHEVQRRLEKHHDFETNIENAFKETFLAVDESLKEEALIEPLYAGTTACVALLRNQQLVLANAGDSRAVCARRSNDGNYLALDLTQDQNPDLPDEQARIEKMGGFVSPPPEPGLSARVWLNADCTQIGLAMARSIGDHAVKGVGVIAEPVVTFHSVTKDDEFVIFATDGVWEFVSSQEAVNVVAENLHRGATRACQYLIETAAAKWHEEEGDYRDDITALVVRLPLLWTSENATVSR